jgi:Tol biopolymer transport system component
MGTAKPGWPMGALATVAVVLVSCGNVGTSTSAAPSTGGATSSAEPETTDGASPHPFAGEEAWIAYQTNRGRESIWLIHPDGSDDHEVGLSVLGEHHHPDWSPDGSQLVITSSTEEELYAVDVATEEARLLWECAEPCVGDDEAAWSPDGSQIVFVRAMEPFIDGAPSCALMVGDPVTGGVEQVGETRSCYDRETYPHWSRDGSRVVYYRAVFEGEQATGSAVYVFDLATGEETQLTEDALVGGDADWSADDEWIVFSTYPLRDFCCEVSNLYRIRPDGSDLEQLTTHETATERATQPRVTPDGEWIVFTGINAEGRLPMLMPADGGEPIAVATSGIYTHPAWQPGP